MTKYRSLARFKVFQPLETGSLCITDAGEIFFWLGADKSVVAQDERYSRSLYWAGTRTYSTVKDVERTVNCFTTDRALARSTVREKFGLYDKNTDPSPKPPRESHVSERHNPTEPDPSGFGSGFFISDDGYLISNNHVVKGAKRIRVKSETDFRDAKVIAQDPENDLALLKIDGNYDPVDFSEDRTAQLGQTIFALGFPLPELQGFTPKVTKGVISSLRGVRDDIRRYQIDAAIQPGNSGGPLADENGNVIGVVVAKLNDAAVIRETGSLPQNVNYAAKKKSYILALLDSYPDVAKKINTSSMTSPKAKFEDAVAKVRKSTVLIIIY